MAINKEWHQKHRMPANATTEQRIEWHLAHQQSCSCREIPAKLAAIMKARNIAMPKPDKY